ncbi:MAG: head decoration protein [Clostridia bacterium]|nr:head decoration protein [Clostridia bacterium]
MKNLNAKVGEMEYDGLVVDLVPEVEVRGGTIRKLAKETTLKRGTILAKSSKDNTLVVLGTEATDGETLTPDCILCDDTVVGTDADVSVSVYTAGCFNTNRVHVADGYTISATDFDALRKYSIVFKAAFAGN